MNYWKTVSALQWISNRWSEEGKKLPVSAAYRELKHYSLEKYIPLFIDYQTVYLSADNNLRYCEDIYKYDSSLLEAMNNLNLKP